VRRLEVGPVVAVLIVLLWCQTPFVLSGRLLSRKGESQPAIDRRVRR